MDNIAKLEQTHINTVSSLDIENKFIENFNQVFSFDNNDIKVVGTIDKPWFRAKDVLKILGYSDNPSTTNNYISKYIPSKYKQELASLRNVDEPYHEAKEVYINEGGLYRLIMRSNKPNAEPFQDYVQDDLLPNIRKQIVENYMSENNSLKNDVRELLKQNQVTHKQNGELILEVHSVRKQNEIALKKLMDMGVQLDDANEKLDEMNDKFDIVVEERAPYPTDPKKTERFILLKRNNEQYPYYVIRARQQACKTALRKQERDYGNIQILLDFDTHPNTKTFYNRIKLNLRRDGVKFSSNQVRIVEGSDMTEERLISELRRIDEEKRDV